VLQEIALVAGDQGSCRRGTSTHAGAPTAAGSVEKRFKWIPWPVPETGTGIL